MSLPVTAKAHLTVHFCVLLWGFTAILGKLISLPALPLVWWRMLIVSVALVALPKVWSGLRRLTLRELAIYASIGVIVALHWLSFYAAIKLANASVAATCIAVAPVFLALVEPKIAARRFQPRELLLAVGVVPGVACVVGGMPRDMLAGLAVGILSAFFVAIFGAMNKRMAGRADALTVTFVELGAGTVFLSFVALVPMFGAAFAWPGMDDAVLLLVLAIACTLLPFALALDALRHISAFAMQIATNLEPVYAIVLAIFLLGEQHELDPLFYVGVAIVLTSVLAHPFMARRHGPALPEVLATAETRSLID